MNKSFTLKSSLVIAALLALPAAQAAAMNKAEYNAVKTRISTDYSADKVRCSALAMNAKDVCMEEAKAKEKVTLAELEYNYSGKPADWNKLLVTKAETTYAVAKERCDDKAGHDKDVCVKEAQAVESKALADAKLNKTVGEARKDATEDKNTADYKVAIEKCDALAGEAKTACVATAKSTYGKS